jgi:transposase
MLNYLQHWIDQLQWQRLKPFQKLTQMLFDHLENILNYCRTKVPPGVVAAGNGNIDYVRRLNIGFSGARQHARRGTPSTLGVLLEFKFQNKKDPIIR